MKLLNIDNIMWTNLQVLSSHVFEHAVASLSM